MEGFSLGDNLHEQVCMWKAGISNSRIILCLPVSTLQPS